MTEEYSKLPLLKTVFLHKTMIMFRKKINIQNNIFTNSDTNKKHFFRYDEPFKTCVFLKLFVMKLVEAFTA